MSYDPSKPSLVPELVLKKKANLDRLSLARQDRLKSQGNRKVFKKNKGEVLKVRKPESFLAAKRNRVNHERRFSRVLKKGLQSKKRKAGEQKTKVVTAGSSDDEDEDEYDDEDEDEDSCNDDSEGGGAAGNKMEGKEKVTFKSNSLQSPVVFCVRVREDDSHTPKCVKKTLGKFRLRSVNEGTFVRFTPEARRQLEAIEQYVTYGVLGEPTVKELLSRRGFAKMARKGGEGEKERVPLNNNVVVEEALGNKTGCICVDDVVEELCNPTENFRTVNNFIWPFRLSSKDSAFEKKKLNARSNGKDFYGDKGEEMNDILRSIL